jgi:hypothetical protein
MSHAPLLRRADSNQFQCFPLCVIVFARGFERRLEESSVWRVVLLDCATPRAIPLNCEREIEGCWTLDESSRDTYMDLIFM